MEALIGRSVRNGRGEIGRILCFGQDDLGMVRVLLSSGVARWGLASSWGLDTGFVLEESRRSEDRRLLRAEAEQLLVGKMSLRGVARRLKVPRSTLFDLLRRND